MSPRMAVFRKTDGPFHALRWSVKVFQRATAARIPDLVPRASLIHETAYVEETSCARLASCPPPAGVMVKRGDPPAGRGQLATSRQIEATHGPGTSDVTVDGNGLPRKPEVPEEWRTALPQGVEVDALVVPCSGLPAAGEE